MGLNEYLTTFLGTSDTVMASIPASAMPKEAFDGHLLVNPLTANPESNLLMLLLCFKNGSLVRERMYWRRLVICKKNENLI
jgi:hypothetical protein